MRLRLKVSRCLKKIALVVLIWILGSFIFAVFFGNVSVARKYTDQLFFVSEHSSGLDGQSLNHNSHLLKIRNLRNLTHNNSGAAPKTAEDQAILKRIFESRAGNFEYISRGNASVFDTSRGQFRIIDNYLHKKEHGFFVEIGTEGGNYGSLTKLLEVKRGWSGLVIEPNTQKFQSLMHVKRNSNFLQSCLNTTGGDWPTNDPSSKPCLNLPDILKAIGKDKIDLLVLDSEGRERQILQSFPFKDVFVGVISLEIHGTSSSFAPSIMNELASQFESVQMMTNHIYWRTDVIFLNKKLIS